MGGGGRTEHGKHGDEGGLEATDPGGCGGRSPGPWRETGNGGVGAKGRASPPDGHRACCRHRSSSKPMAAEMGKQ